MSNRFLRVVLALALLVCGAASSALAQGLTGQISGVVTDNSGGVLPGATVTVKNVGTNLVRETTTAADGTYVITNLLAGTFDLSVSVQGFKPYQQKGIVLGATERLALRAIALEVGGLSEVVSVSAESVKVQTTSGERSATMTAAPDRGRRPARPRLHGQPQGAAGRHRHVGARRPGLGLGRQHVDQRSDVVQLLLRRRHQQGHRLELGQLRRAGARLDRRGEGAGLELPGRVRPQLGRDDHRRDQERHARLPRHGGVLQAQRSAQHQQLGSPPRLRYGREEWREPGQCGELQQGAVSLRQHRLDAGRAGADSRYESSTTTATSCSSSFHRICCRGTIPARCS